MRVSEHRVLVVAMVLLMVAVIGWFEGFLPSATPSVDSFCRGVSNPSQNVVLCEDFEDDAVNTRWDIGSNRGLLSASRFVRCDDDFGFHDRCAAWSNQLVFDNAWGFYGYDGRRAFTPQSEFYVRWYQYISSPYVWGTLEDKSVMLHDRANTITAYVGTNRVAESEPNSGPGMPFVANYQDLDWQETGGQNTRVDRFQNQRKNITLRPGRWYLFEWYIKLNTPGASDGVTKLWIDDATEPIASQSLRMQYTDLRWLRSSDVAKQFGVLRLTVYHQRCDGVPSTCPPRGPAVLNQSQRWDRIVISKSPVGPIVGSEPGRK